MQSSALAGFVLAAAIAAAPSISSDPIANLPVPVEIFEQIPARSPFHVEGLQPTDRYSEQAFGFVRTPTKVLE